MTDIVDELKMIANMILTTTVYIDREKALNKLAVYRAAKEIERLRDALMKIEYLDRPQVRGLPRRDSIQEIALAALDNNNG